MLGKVAAGLGLRSLTTSVGAAAGAAYGTLSGLSKAAGTIANAAQGAADAAKEKTNTPATNIIYVNFGMAGSAGKQKIAGGGTLPARSNVAKPQVSEKMPTAALLDTAVKYLNSIDKSLKAQLDFEKRSYERQMRDEREAIIENKSSFSFGDIKDRFSNLKTNVSEGAGLAGKLAKYAIGLGGLAALVASATDQKELDALKENVDQFKKSFGWLGELGTAVGAGGLLGFLFGGRGVAGRLKGGLVGMVASHIVDRMFPSLFGGEVDPVTGEPIKENRSMSPLQMALSVGAGAYAAGYGLKKYREVKTRVGRMQSLGRMTAGGTASQSLESVRKGNSWLATKRGRKFLALVAKKLGKTLFAKVVKTLGRVAAFLLLSATGVGAIAGILGILGSIAFLGWDIYDIATSIWDAWNESKVEDTEASAIPAATTADATPAAGAGVSSLAANRIVSKSETGSPEKAQAFFESRGWTREQAAGIVGNIAVESGFDPNASGDGGDAWGLAQWNKRYSPDRVANFERVMKTPLRGSTFEQQLEFIDWELKNTEKAAGNLLRGATTAAEAAQIVDSKYERSDGSAIDRRISNANAAAAGDYSKVSTGGASGYSSSSGKSAVGDMATASMKKIGELLGTLGSAVIKPGIARSFETPSNNTASKINNESIKLQTDLTLGVKKEKTKDQIKTPALPNVNPGIAKPIKSISSMDPNYSNINVLSQYLGHFKRA